MKFFFSIILLYFLTKETDVMATPVITLSDTFNSFKSITKGLGKEAINVIPRPEELARLPIEILVGIPENVIFSLVDGFCSIYLAADTIMPKITPNITAMNFILRTSCKNITFPLTESEKILESDYFDINKKLVLFVTGWTSSPNASSVTSMAKAFHCREDYNFLVLDAANFIDTLYTWSAFNTKEIGRLVALGLKNMVERGLPVENIHLIGHSLGAHIVGYAGRYFKNYTSLSLPRITGLDPANPCFNEGHTLYGLGRGVATFVDVIHSNPGGLGMRDSLGDVDFYPAGYDIIKPGCKHFGCSHSRSYEYFVESIYRQNKNNFLAVECDSLYNLRRQYCTGMQYPMGLNVPLNITGNYFLDVNGKMPYGKNNNKENALLSNCGACKADASKKK